ncbi:efflux RND transporter permease subunit [bacterium]|nr:efflux RND transporter permease subunit [candidate division CSSED10-310 bacterium]
MWISDISIKRPVTTLILMAAILIFGAMAFYRMGMDLMPDIEFPFITVQTVLVGASPEVIDQDVTDVIEEQINTVSGLRTLTSMSYEGFSFVMAEFDLEKDVDVAANEVRDKVNLAKTTMPTDVEEPLIDKFDIASMPIIWISVSSTGDYRALSEYADKVIRVQLQSVLGVGNIELSGLREREIRVWLDPLKLQARQLTAQDVVRAIQSKHVELPGGRIETGEREYTIKVEGEYESVEEFTNLVVSESNGAPIYLKDIARIDDASEDQRSIARFNGMPSIGMGVRKQSDANAVEVARSIKSKMVELQKSAPEEFSIDIAFDTSKYIEQSMKGVQTDIGFGVLLTALIIFFFLRNLRITSISLLAIPISLIGGFIAMNAMGFTVNNITMLAMSLSVGLVIDDTVVVLENIFRHIERGEKRMSAAGIGAHEVTLAVIASTSSIAAVFIPVAFMKGIIGRFFYQFGLTVAMTTIISTFASLTLTPFMCSRTLVVGNTHSRLYRVLENLFIFLEKIYRRTLHWAVHHRLLVILIAVCAFVVGLMLVPIIGSEFMTQADESRFAVQFELPTGTSLSETNERILDFERMFRDIPGIQDIFTTIGSAAGGQVNKASTTINLVPKNQRSRTQREIMGEVREVLSESRGIIYSVGPVDEMGGGRSADVQYVIQGPGVEQLQDISRKVIRELEQHPELVDVDTDLRLTKPDVKVKINRHLADDLGVDVQSISTEIYAMFGGMDVAKFKEGGYRYDIRVRALPQYRKTPADLNLLSVRNLRGELIKAPNILTYEVGQGPNVINRYNRRFSVSLFANLHNISAGEGLKIVEAAVRKHLPADGAWNAEVSGMSQIFVESFQYLLEALFIAILVIYMVLAIQFESFIHPFTIMTALPFTMIGVFGALLLSGMTLNIFSFIGIIMLMGLVTKNGILLVDFANQARGRGMDSMSAILEAGQLRLRPILMTAFSTVIGVVPVALALSEGGEMRAPMAVSVIGGLTTSTLLTLIVIPVIYLLLDDLTRWSERQFRKLRRSGPEPTGTTASSGDAQ